MNAVGEEWDGEEMVQSWEKTDLNRRHPGMGATAVLISHLRGAVMLRQRREAAASFWRSDDAPPRVRS